jgi:hypothetical protein
LRDNSTNDFAITVNGNPSVQPFSPFAPSAAYSPSVNGGSGYFDGSGDYLNCKRNMLVTLYGVFLLLDKYHNINMRVFIRIASGAGATFNLYNNGFEFMGNDSWLSGHLICINNTV